MMGVADFYYCYLNCQFGTGARAYTKGWACRGAYPRLTSVYTKSYILCACAIELC